VPTLCPRDIVIADNLGSHKNKAARMAIRKRRESDTVDVGLAGRRC
jgi:hypothetical protein